MSSTSPATTLTGEALTLHLFDELVKLSGGEHAYMDALTDDVIERWVERAASGGIGHGFFDIDADECRRQWNRQKVIALFMRYRALIGSKKVRGIIPALLEPAVTASQSLPPAVAIVPPKVQPRPWVLSVDHHDALEAHARGHLNNDLETTVKLHGGTLVALGIMSWDEVKQLGVERVQTVCDDMKQRS